MRLRSLLRPPTYGKEFRVLTLFVTSRCGLDCEGCFYGDELNNDKIEMTLEEHERLADSIGHFQGLLISGGEPYLRKDLPEIIRIYRERCGIGSADTPTAGVNPNRVEEMAGRIASISPEMQVTVGVSLDGPPDYHDRYRRGKRVFEHAIESIKRLKALHEKHPNIWVNVLSVATKENVELLPEMWRIVTSEVRPHFWHAELVRPFQRGQDIDPPSMDSMKALHDFVIEENRKIVTVDRPEEAAMRLSHLESLYRHQRLFYERGSTGVDCLAGEALGAVMPDGEVRLCEVLESVGHLRERDYDFWGILRDAISDRQRESILRGDCACTHCVNLGHSLLPSRKAQTWRVWREFQRERELKKVQTA